MSDEKTKIMFVMRRPPHGAIYSYEGLEVILITGAYEQDVSVMFMGDGVFALKKEQDTHELGIKGFAKTYLALEDYDITQIYVDRQSLEERGLTEADLVIPVTTVDAAAAAKLMSEQHTLLPF